jgi:hypothetical protein
VRQFLISVSPPHRGLFGQTLVEVVVRSDDLEAEESVIVEPVAVGTAVGQVIDSMSRATVSEFPRGGVNP